MSVMIILPLMCAIVSLDQLIKIWVINNLKVVDSIVIIPGIFKLTYVENYGAAFGMMGGMRWLLIIVTAVILSIAVYALISKKLVGTIMNISVLLISSGGLGNLIDRIRLGFVVDYLDINDLFSYPMFNLADCCVVIGAILIVIYILFFDGKDNEIIRHKGSV